MEKKNQQVNEICSVKIYIWFKRLIRGEGLTILTHMKHGKDQLAQQVRDHRQAVSNILAATLPFVTFKDMLRTSSMCLTTATISTIKPSKISLQIGSNFEIQYPLS